MENRKVYKVDGMAESIREVCLTPLRGWVAPQGVEIKAALQLAGWSGEEYARQIGVDGRTVRRWVGDEKTIPYTAWCVLAVQAGLGLIWQNEPGVNEFVQEGE